VLPLARIVWFLTDEPPVGNTTVAGMVLSRSEGIKTALPGSRCMIDYYDADSVAIYKGLDLIAADLYVNKFGYNFQLVTALGQACTAASLPFTTTFAVASDTPPLTAASEIAPWVAAGEAAGSQGFCGYAWGLGLEGAQYVSAVQALS
jgi:hypothetical protein